MRNSDRRAARSIKHTGTRRLASAVPIGILCLGALLAVPAQAQPGWGGYGWGRPGWNDPWGGPSFPSSTGHRKDPRDGRIQVSRFVRDDATAARLGHGYVTVTSKNFDGEGGDWVAPENRARFEAAVENSLINAGYDTLGQPGPDSQVATLSIRQRVLVPAEAKRNPVSGSAAVSVGTYGQAYGLALNLDLTKPLPALISTRVDLSIRDRADGSVLWEGNAEIATYEGDDDWSEDKIATRLAEALLDGFPEGQPVTVPVTEIGIPEHPPVMPMAPEDETAESPEGMNSSE